MNAGLLNSAYTLYKKVVKDFLEIKEGEIKLDYNHFVGSVGFSLIDLEKYDVLGEIVLKPTLVIGPFFPFFTQEEKEASIAHELGHYMYDKKLSNVRIEARLKHNEELWHLENALNNMLPSPFTEHKTKRLKQFRIAKENQANKEAAKAGYGAKLLNLYINSYPHACTEWEKEKTKAIITDIYETIRK
jgi:hypothetical protein